MDKQARLERQEGQRMTMILQMNSRHIYLMILMLGASRGCLKVVGLGQKLGHISKRSREDHHDY